MSLTIVYSTQQQNALFSEHLKQTCGIQEVEILQFINLGHYDLSQIYNHALNTANHDFIVFIHDDIEFKTLNWGRCIINNFNQSDFAILGVAGTTDLPITGIWWQDASKMIGRLKHRQGEKIWSSHYSSHFEDKILPVVCVDGVLIAVNRKKLQAIFNESLKGFHFYDIDFCLSNYMVGAKIGVIFDIKIIHHSIGITNEQWENNRLQFISSHAYHLPCRLKGQMFIDYTPVILPNYPELSIIILHKSHNYLLFNCLLSISTRSIYPNFEIIIADTGSSKTELDEIHQFIAITQLKIRIIEFNYYHFAQINNLVVSSISSELILFCNNDIELINDAISKMVSVYIENSKECGTIGCRLYFADGTIQHAGIELTVNNDELQIGHKGFHSYYQYATDTEKNTLGSTAAFLLIEKNLFKNIGGFNSNYLDCLEDIELNLACIKYDKINYFIGEGICYHFESQTRKNQGIILKEDYQRLWQYLKDNPEVITQIHRNNSLHPYEI